MRLCLTISDWSLRSVIEEVPNSPALEVCLTQNLWRHIQPKRRGAYAERIAAEQLPGSLVVLDMDELDPKLQVEEVLCSAGYRPEHNQINDQMQAFINITKSQLPYLKGKTKKLNFSKILDPAMKRAWQPLIRHLGLFHVLALNIPKGMLLIRIHVYC